MYAHPALAEDHGHRNAILASAPDMRGHVARLIDSTVLKPDTSADRIQALCREAAEYGFRSVCVPPCFVALCRGELESGRGVSICTVIGFPTGYASTESKVAETEDAVGNGADEIDFVQNDCWVKDSNWGSLESEYKAIVGAAAGRLVKIILETSLLSDEEIRECAVRAVRAGVHVVKTATGFGSRGASKRDIEIMASALSDVGRETGLTYGIKASGGIRSTEDALAFVKLGATRLGTSSGAAIAKGV